MCPFHDDMSLLYLWMNQALLHHTDSEHVAQPLQLDLLA